MSHPMTDAHAIAARLSEGDAAAMAICAERCAYPYGEPPCWQVGGALTPNCAGPDEPDCSTLGRIAAAALKARSAR